jgi:hypothetical protein
MWHARHGENKAIWAHVDEDCWTVFRALSLRGTLAEFLAAVEEQSRDDGREHEYAWDVFGAEVGSVRRGNRSILDDVRDSFSRWSPQLMESVDMGGSAGLARIGDLILGTMARWPDEACWRGREAESERYASGEMLAIVPVEVLEELERAYYRPQSARASADDPVESAVGGGGGYTRCLRMLAIAGVECQMPPKSPTTNVG